MKTNKILRIVVPVTATERRIIRRAVAPVNGRAQAIAAWARDLMMKEARRILGVTLLSEIVNRKV